MLNVKTLEILRMQTYSFNVQLSEELLSLDILFYSANNPSRI